MGIGERKEQCQAQRTWSCLRGTVQSSSLSIVGAIYLQMGLRYPLLTDLQGRAMGSQRWRQDSARRGQRAFLVHCPYQQSSGVLSL